MAGKELYIYQVENEGENHELHLDEETYRRVENDEQLAADLIHNFLRNSRIPERRDPAEMEFRVDEPNFELETETKERNHTWQYDMVICLIKSMEVHHENLSHPKKRKNVFDNISNDMLSQGFAVNPNMVQNKWKSLVRSYKVTKDNKNRTGRAPSRFLFFEEMDAILGNKPSNKCLFSLESSEIIDEDNFGHFEPAPIIDLEQEPSTSTGLSSTPTGPSRSRQSPSSEPSRKRKKNFKSISEENKMIRHRERMEIETKKLKLEEKKVKLIEEFLRNSSNKENCDKN